MENVLDKFLRYVATDTQSSEESDSCPSTEGQLRLLRMLTDELRSMGVDAEIDRWGYVYAHIASNLAPDDARRKEARSIGFISHADTSPDAPGSGVRPQIVQSYGGGDILLKGSGDTLSPRDFPELEDYVGQTLVTTDGTTLLGADDKAGIAEIMTAVEYMTEHPGFLHPDLSFAFTPDEEIGRSVEHFDVEKFGAAGAYTMDGGAIGELEYENFNAASAIVSIRGRSVHPGYAKGKMINSQRVAVEFDALLPCSERPECTEGYEGFYHLVGTQGSVECTTLKYIIRDHDENLFRERKSIMEKACSDINLRYGPGTASVEIKDSYYNMRKMVEPHMYLVDNARAAMLAEGVKPVVRPIRGGTDGATLSFRGLPCPNLFTGGQNFHGRFEYIPVESMEKAVAVILRLCRV